MSAPVSTPTPTALQRRDDFEPSTLAEGYKLSEFLAGSSLIPDDLKRKPADVMVVLMTGRELGLSPMQSMRSIYVVKGRPFLSADLLMALCQRSPVCEYIQLIESTPERCTYEAKRKGSKPVRMTYTIEEARGADLLKNDVWRKYPADQTRHRCATRICRAVFSDLVLGFGDESERMEAMGHSSPAALASFLPPPAPAVSPAAVDVQSAESAETAPAAPADAPTDAEFTEAAAAPADQTDREWCLGAIASMADLSSLEAGSFKAELGRRTSDPAVKAEVLKAFGERKKALGGGK